MLKALVLTLAVLAGAKIWTQERLYRDGAEEALLRAYRERAMAACQSAHIPFPDPTPRYGPGPRSVGLVIGRSNVDVRIWQLSSERWPARFKHPHVVLTLGNGAEAPVCEYDVIEERAFITQM
ncbi:MAG: hypothetical protein WDN31_13510 [Hyphomicrobium sp.]